jgi:lysozyme
MISEVISRLKIDEGFYPYVYLDTRNFSTLGFGFCVDRRGGIPLPDEIASSWLALLAGEAQATAQTYPWWPSLNDARQNVITCLLYNLGQPKFDTFVLLQAALVAGDWQEAANQLENSAWFRQVGVRGSVYVQILATGNWPTNDVQ